MRDNALFFPFVSVPQKQWTYRMLLYWDKLTSIVPIDHVERPDQMTNFMRTLLREGLVEQLHPGQHLYQIEEFDSNFKKLIESRLNKIRAFQKQNPNHPLYGNVRSSLIHAEKLGVIQNYLVQIGVAKRSHDDWYSIECWAANLFMAYLASCLGALSEVNAAPVTNRVQVANLYSNFTGPNISKEARKHSTEARDLIMKALLPYPSEGVSMSSLIDFKVQHGDLLPKFRNRVEAHCIQVATIDNAEHRKLITDNFISDALEEVSFIQSVMRPFWKKLSFSSITPIIGAGLSTTATQISDTVAISGAVITLSSTVAQAISSINERSRLRDAPLAYVAYSRGKLA